jgi:glycine oxidase
VAASNRASPDVVVIGGGVIGLALAWRAAQRGLRVVVLERAEFGGGTSHVAAGMLAPGAEADPREAGMLAANLASAKLYPSFVQELEEASGADTGYLTCGTLLAARDSDEAEALARELELRQQLGLPVHRLLPSQARRLEPSLAPTVRLALQFPDDHAIDPRRLASALAAAASREGAVLRGGVEVTELRVQDSRIAAVVLASGEVVHAGEVVVAAGAWSSEIGGLPVNARVPLRPVKGQILALNDRAGSGLLTRVLRTFNGYVVPRGDGRYVLGATVEERGFDTTTTAGAVFELLRDAVELLPGLSELAVDELEAGLRPATPDNVPAIGPGVLDGLHWAVGHYRHGVLLAPLTAAIGVAGLLEEPLNEEAQALDPRRFANVAVSA